MSNTEDTIAELRRELTALQQRVVALESHTASTATITCSALTVVDAQNNPVASIDPSGLLQCRRIMVADTGGNSLYYDPPFGELVIRTDGTPVVRINESALGTILLSAPAKFNSQARAILSPDVNGGMVELWDSSGKLAIFMGVSSAGGTAEFKSRDPQNGSIRVGVDGSGSGQIVVVDTNGTISAQLP